MSYGSDDSSELARMSTKKLAILFGLAFLGAFMLFQMIQGFPLAQLITRKTVTEEVVVAFKQGDVCVVEPSDRTPKEIRECRYSIGDVLIVTFYNSSTKVESHELK